MGNSFAGQHAPALKLYYFPIEGKGAPIRMLMRHLGYPFFVDYRFRDREEFETMKAAGAFTFGQVPALEIKYQDGRREQLCQTNSILRFIGKIMPESGTYPSDPVQAALVDSIMDQEADMFMGLACSKYRERLGYGSLDDDTVVKVRKDLNDEVIPRSLAFFENLLATSSSGWLASTPGPTICDFLLAPRLDWLSNGGAGDGISLQILHKFPLLLTFLQKFNALPAVIAYLREQRTS